MPVGRNSVHGPSRSPVYDPAPIHGVRKVYRTGGFDLPPFHQAGFVTSSGIEAVSVGYPAPVALVLSSATITLRSAGGGTVTFVINVNGIPTEELTISAAGLITLALAVTLEPGDVVTSQVTATTGSPEDFLVVLRAELAPEAPAGCAPFALYNFYRNDAAGGGAPLVNDGYKGSIFDISPASTDTGPLDRYWGADFGTWLSPSDFGGNLGPGPITWIIAPNSSFYQPNECYAAWIMGYAGTPQYSIFRSLWQNNGPGDGVASLWMRWIDHDGVTAYETNSTWVFDPDELTGGNLVAITITPGVGGTWTDLSGLTHSAYDLSTTATPDSMNEGFYPAAGKKDAYYLGSTSEVFGISPVVHYMAWVNGTVDLNDWTAARWNAFSPTGDPYPPQLTVCEDEAPPPSTPTFRSSTSVLANLTATLTPPDGVQPGDLLVLCAMRRTTHTVSTNDPFISSTGGQSWLEVGQNFNSGYSLRVWSAIASGTLTNVVIDGTETFSGQATCNAALLVFKAGTFDPSRPGGTGPHGVQLAAASSGFSAFTVSTINPTVANSLRLVVAGARRNGVSGYGPMTVDTGWGMRVELNAATGLANNSGMVVAEKPTPASGPTAFTDTVTEGGGNFIQTFHLAIYPPP